MSNKKQKTYHIKLEESEEDFLLLGIQTPLEGHRLAYLINTHLNIRLRKNKIDLIFTKNNFESQFGTYDYDDETHYISWSLIHNVFKSLVLDKNPFDLFATEPFYSSRIDYLLAEEKEVNFLLKITGINEIELEKIARKIRKIYNIELLKPIDLKTLKNKKNLIF